MNLLKSVKKIQPFKVYIADGKFLLASDVGNLTLDNGNMSFLIQDVYLVEGLSDNLLSVSELAKSHNILFTTDHCILSTREGKELLKQEQQNGVYIVQAKAAKADKGNYTLKEVHELLGHLNYQSLRKMGNLDVGFNLFDNKPDVLPCSICVKGKLSRNNIPKISTTKTTMVGELVHSDVWGPAQNNSYRNYRYFVTFIDDFSKYIVTIPIEAKSDVLYNFKCYVNLVETQINVKIKCLRSDNGGEYVSKEFHQYCRGKGIKRQLTVPHSSFQNGVAERTNRTLIEGIRCLLIGAQMEKKYWCEAVVHITYIRNMVLQGKEEKAPCEMFLLRKPDYSRLLPFGSPVWVQINEKNRKKLDEVAKKGVYVGVDKSSKGIRVIVHGRLIISRDYVLSSKREKRSIMLDSGDKVEESEDEEIHVQTRKAEKPDILKNPSTENEGTASDYDASQYYSGSEGYSDTVSDADSYKEMTGYLYDVGADVDPKNILDYPRARRLRSLAVTLNINARDAIADPEWKIAMDSEIESQSNNGTWSLVEKPKEAKVLPCKWIFTLKAEADGSKRKKARLVIGGHRQREGIDYQETFAPVVKYQSVRTLLALATYHDWYVHQMDFVTAFLNAEVDVQLYMQQPPGYEDGTPKVCRIQKGLYGLKQAPRGWNQKLNEIMKKFKFEKNPADDSVYIKHMESNLKIIVAVYVDDLIIISNNLEEIEVFKKGIKKLYNVKDLGELSLILGMRWKRNHGERKSTLKQTDYIQEILKKFGMQDSKIVSTPAVKMDEEESKSLPTNQKYMEVVGSLIYLTTCTRPDIAYAVSKVSEHLKNPTEKDWITVKRILRYLKGTQEIGLVFGGSEAKRDLEGWADADWAGDAKSRLSRTGYVFKIAGGAISWSSKKQASIALSTAEAEYVSGCLGTQEAVWLRRFIEGLGEKLNTPILNMDNQGAIALGKNPVHHNRTKHIDIKYHFIREKVLNGEIDLRYCPTQDMIADTLTKALAKPSFKKFSQMMGLDRE